MADKKYRKHEIPLDGKLITSVDPSLIGHNFQTLTNMRYYGNRIRGVGGMTKINSSIMNATYLKTRSGIHFSKDQPSESHVLAQAFDTGLTASRILQNTTAIPSAGNFSATSLYTPTGTIPGRWSTAPDGDVAYCNTEESCVWGGDEREIAGFINYDLDGSFSYDFTEQLRNTKDDSANIATLSSRSSGLDANVKLLCHLNNNTTDSSTGTHTVTPSGTYSYSSPGQFGSHRLWLQTDAKLTISDHADFDFSGGSFTIDTWAYVRNFTTDTTLYYQNTTNDNDSFKFFVDTNGAITVTIKAGGTKQFSGATDFKTADSTVGVNAGLRHFELVEDGNNWYLFYDGVLKAYTSDAARAANYTGDILVGYDSSAYATNVEVDEFRVSLTNRHSSDFEPPTEEYSTESTAADFYLASIRPLDGFKLYVDTANTAVSTMQGWYWNGSGWVGVSNLVDGTSASSKSLAQTGSVTFDSTVSTAKLKYIDGVLSYWYKISISATAGSPALYHATLSTPFQEIVDSWDGAPRLTDSFQIYKTNYSEATTHVRESDYDSLNSGTFVNLKDLTSSQWVICGFLEKTSGVTFNFASGLENTTTGTICTVDYWDGSDWATVGTIDDGTMSENISWAKSGTIAWQPPATEFTQAINASRNLPGIEAQPYKQKSVKIKYKARNTQSINNDVQLYYYRFMFSETITNSSSIVLFNVTGIPAQTSISAYKFPFFANDRLWLCSDQKSDKNSAICSADGSSSVFNGDDSLFFTFGDDSELTGAAWLFTSIGSNIFNVMVFFKNHETWAIIGNDIEDWTKSKYKISSTVGCVAPETIKVVDIGTQSQKGSNRMMVVFQAADGIYITDGRAPVKISEDIDDKFDPRVTGSINTGKLDDSVGEWDSFNKCYHWYWASGSSTTLNEESVFDFKKPGWFNIDRGAAGDLQYNISVKDTTGNKYNYGFLDTGYMYRLNFGNNFDSTTIAQTFQTGDMAPAEGSISTETKADFFGLIAKSKTTTTSTISITHYADGRTTGTSWTEATSKSGYRIIAPIYHDQIDASIFHSLKCTISTDDEVFGFEPLYLYILYRIVRDHITDWR